MRDGVWEVCSDAYFNGQCVRLQPGEYRNLRGSLDRSISSAREVGQAAYAPPAPVYGGQQAPVYGGPGARGGGEPRAILYSGNGMSGRTFEIDRDVVRNLERVGFNDRASSLTILNGYWIFLQRRQFRRRLPHLRPRRLSESPVRSRPQDFVRTQDRGPISVRRTADLVPLTEARYALCSKITERRDAKH